MSRTDGAAVPGPLGWVAVVVVCASMALAAVLELFLVPLYVGRALVPITLLFVLVGNVALPRVAAACCGSVAGAVLAFLSWLVPAFYLAGARRPEGDVILPGGGYVQLVGYGVIFGGAVAGAVGLALSAPGPRLRADAATRSARGAPGRGR